MTAKTRPCGDNSQADPLEPYQRALEIVEEMAARPPVVFRCIREASAALGIPGREIRDWIRKDGRAKAKKVGRFYTQVAIPFHWWYSSPGPEARRAREARNRRRRERRAQLRAGAADR